MILTGEVSDQDLASIYSGAHALILTSENEGFGLTAVEALACGTPVAACEAPALREVLGERASFVECGDMDALIDAAQRAVRPAPAPPDWSWQRAARSTWGVYASVAEPAQQPRHAASLANLRPHAAGGAVEGAEAQRRPGAGTPPGSSSAGSSGRAPATSARDTEVQVHEIVEVELRAPGHLPQARDAREHEVALAVPVLEHLVVALGQRPRPDQRHVAAQHVHQLRQLVEREAPQEAPDRGQPRVVADLEQGARRPR